MKKLLLSALAGLFLFSSSFAEQVFTIKVEGMTCKMCVLAIKKSLKDVKGVKKADVSLEKKKAVVITEDFVKPQKLLKAIQRAGMYKGTILKLERK